MNPDSAPDASANLPAQDAAGNESPASKPVGVVKLLVGVLLPLATCTRAGRGAKGHPERARHHPAGFERSDARPHLRLWADESVTVAVSPFAERKATLISVVLQGRRSSRLFFTNSASFSIAGTSCRKSG